MSSRNAVVADRTKESLSARLRGERLGEVGADGGLGSCRWGTPHPPTADALGPSLSPLRAERVTSSMLGQVSGASDAEPCRRLRREQLLDLEAALADALLVGEIE